MFLRLVFLIYLLFYTSLDHVCFGGNAFEQLTIRIMSIVILEKNGTKIELFLYSMSHRAIPLSNITFE